MSQANSKRYEKIKIKIVQKCLVNCSHYIPLKLWENNHPLPRIPLIVNMGHFTFTTFLTFLFLTFHRATVKKGVTFRTATPSNSLLWEITLDMGTDGAIAVICQRKAPIPGKRQVCSLHITLHASVCYLCLDFVVAGKCITYLSAQIAIV